MQSTQKAKQGEQKSLSQSSRGGDRVATTPQPKGSHTQARAKERHTERRARQAQAQRYDSRAQRANTETETETYSSKSTSRYRNYYPFTGWAAAAQALVG